MQRLRRNDMGYEMIMEEEEKEEEENLTYQFHGVIAATTPTAS